MTTNEEDSGYDLENRGEYEAAAAAYARTGFSDLVNAGFELDGEWGTYQGIGLLAQAISCDRRAGNHRRPAYLANICRPLLQEIRETTDDAIQAGLAAEWLGDLALMLGQDVEGIHTFYDEAAKQFEGMDWRDELRTGEPDFTYTYRAIQRFSEYHDGPLPRNPDTMSFHERLEQKQKLADQILD